MILLELLGYASLIHIIVDFISNLDLPEIPNKPFKCDLCMGYWLSVLPLVVTHGARGILLAGIVGVVADLIFRIKNRI